ncbi:Diaminopimelate epimerase-like protein [Teratosphaeria nubilosa]|uniref:Diaminopimelate epimerase-like protein n=1 Tax=Teratosphaeria nubilosa TaxID=161662 RepID=A0A6G1LDE1_9PEZI|nr:Diaminopimelate epimerase-like protein [Teratosphaeria nubilosa]
MPQLPFVTLDVFTKTRFEGNPLGLVKIPEGHDVSTERMQSIAREFNLSETVFLYEGKIEDGRVPEWRFRIFLTDRELPFAGHPTIGTAAYALGTLAKGAPQGRLICQSGPVWMEQSNGVLKASIPHNVHIHTENQHSAKHIFDLQPRLAGNSALTPNSIDVASPVRGINFYFAELPSLEALSLVETTGVKPKPNLDRDWNVGFAGSYFYVFTKDNVGSCGQAEVRTRMIAGTFEDPATGAAACGLCALLALRSKVKSLVIRITQAVEIGRMSVIGVTVTLNDGLNAVEKVELSGSAVKVMEGFIEY